MADQNVHDTEADISVSERMSTDARVLGNSLFSDSHGYLRVNRPLYVRHPACIAQLYTDRRTWIRSRPQSFSHPTAWDSHQGVPGIQTHDQQVRGECGDVPILNGDAEFEENVPEDDEDDNVDDEEETFLMPILPIEVAVISCFINFILPGVGTMIAGLCVPCCGKPSDLTKRQSWGSCIAMIGIGFLQLLMVACFLIGWVWSGLWGISLVQMAMEYYKEDNTESHWRESRRLRSNLIYPLRARSNTRYQSPPPPYQMYSSPPPGYLSDDQNSQCNTDSQTNGQLPHPGYDVVQSSGRTRPTYWQCKVCCKQYAVADKKFNCRRCFETVCSQCFSKQVIAPNGQKIVVCDMCFNEIGMSETAENISSTGSAHVD